jgi:hypothetical protein
LIGLDGPVNVWAENDVDIQKGNSAMKYLLLCLGGVILAAGQWASADVVYSSYPKGTAGTYNVRGLGIPQPQADAERFTPSANYSFSSAKLALVYFSGLNSFTISLYNDAGPGGTPGAALETFSPVTATPDATTDVVVNSITHPALTSGDNYYLVAVANGTDTYGGWTVVPTNGGPFGFGSSSTDGGTTWSTPINGNAATFEIDGIVPEPATGALLMVGGLALLAARRRNA